MPQPMSKADLKTFIIVVNEIYVGKINNIVLFNESPG